MDAAKLVEAYGVIPVIAITEVRHAVPLATALIEGGLPLIEVTLRTNAALDSIIAIKKKFPEMLVGAGTVLRREQVDEALKAGADFIVSPGHNPAVSSYCKQKQIPIFPGCTTTSEIEGGIETGLSIFKFFPAEQQGGIKAIELLSGPYPNIKFIPTGGITYANLATYLSCDAVAACGGSFMAPKSDIEAENWDKISKNCKKAMDISLGFELAHIGINHANEDEALKTADSFCDLFRLPVKVGSSSIFAGTAVECMKSKYYGERGHIGFLTNSTLRAKAFFVQNGVKIREDTIRLDQNGKIISFYFEEEIMGFAVHVVRRSK